jgi:kinesin family member 2/24
MKNDDWQQGKLPYEKMINDNWLDSSKSEPHTKVTNMRICICVRKRPIFKKEIQAGNFDCVSTKNP